LDGGLILPANSESVTIPRKKMGKLKEFSHYKTKRPNMDASGRFRIDRLPVTND